jgi:hypothetical protein
MGRSVLFLGHTFVLKVRQNLILATRALLFFILKFLINQTCCFAKINANTGFNQ